MSITFSLVSIVPKPAVNDNGSLVQIPATLLKELQIEKDKNITLRLGKKTVPVQINVIDTSGNEIHLPEDIFKALQLPIGIYKFKAKYDPDCLSLQLGPVIGLLTDFRISGDGKPDFRSIQAFCEELHQVISENGGFFYVFAYQQFFSPCYYLRDGNWVPSTLPLPDAVYNRIHSRRLEQSISFKKFRKQLEQLAIPIFNDRFLSKWEVYQQLIAENESRSYIPETQLLSKESLAAFTEKYDTVFIKPVHGSQGRDIMKLKKTEHPGLLTFQTSFKNPSAKAVETCSIECIWERIQSYMGRKIYIIQEGIPLLANEGSPMDFRVLCHKNHLHSWIVTSIVARIAAEEEFVSNISKGGKVLRPLQALSQAMDKKKALAVLKDMKTLSIDIASIISTHSHGIIGELGIDIGVDNWGNLWLIEVNSKPSKNFEVPGGKIRPSAKAIIRFCQSLAFNNAL